MKKIRLAILLTVVLALTSTFGACSFGSDLDKYFKPEAIAEKAYSSVTRLDGALCASNSEHNIIALRVEETTASGSERETIKVVNALNGETLVSRTEYDSNNTESFNVELDKYPLIVFNRTVENDSGYNHYYDYYLVKNGGNGVEVNNIYNGDEPIRDYKSYVNGIMTFSIDDITYWVNKKGEIVRQFLSSVTSVYGSPTGFYAEYNDYLYDWVLPGSEETSALGNRINVFNKAGVCNVQYMFPATVFMAKVFVLNNGNIFVQEYEYALAGKEYNSVYYMDMFRANVNVTSRIINYQTGEVSVLNLGFIVEDLESAYNTANSEESCFPFVLQDDYQNQAKVVDFDVTGLSAKTRYVVLDNLMNVVYEMVNDEISTNPSWIDYISWVGEDHYFAPVYDAEGAKFVLYNLKGKAKFVVNPNEVVDATDEYVVTTDAIYNLKGKEKYNFDELIGGNKEAKIDVVDGRIYVSKKNYATGCTDVYKIGLEKRKLTASLISEGIRTSFEDLGGIFLTYDLEMGVSSLLNQDGEVLLKVKGKVYNDERAILDDVVIIEDEVNDKDVCYVIK